MNGVRIAAVLPGGDARYYLTDQVDSVKLVVDDDGHAVSRMEHFPYGDVWFQEGAETHSPKFNSQELDKETGFYFFNARHYDPGLSRFISADSVIDGVFDTQGWNAYSYCKGNPVVYKDPEGNSTKHDQTTITLTIGVGSSTILDVAGKKLGEGNILLVNKTRSLKFYKSKTLISKSGKSYLRTYAGRRGLSRKVSSTTQLRKLGAGGTVLFTLADIGYYYYQYKQEKISFQRFEFNTLVNLNLATLSFTPAAPFIIAASLIWAFKGDEIYDRYQNYIDKQTFYYNDYYNRLNEKRNKRFNDYVVKNYPEPYQDNNFNDSPVLKLINNKPKPSSENYGPPPAYGIRPPERIRDADMADTITSSSYDPSTGLMTEGHEEPMTNEVNEGIYRDAPDAPIE